MNPIMPPEWAPHQRVWIGFPWDPREWPVGLEEAQAEIAAFASAVHDDGNGEDVYLITGDDASFQRARKLAAGGVHVEQRKIGDCWLRDTACLIVQNENARLAQNFRFNGWGGKYLMAGDQTIGRELAEDAALPVADCEWVLEGGAIDVDGHGLAVTTEECLLNPNRNPDMSREDIEAALQRDLGIDRLLWLGGGLVNDHTDGHVDNLARFVAPGHLLLPRASGDADPNTAVYLDALKRAQDFGVQITLIPSPGKIESAGEVIPASHMNFYIGNSVVAVPVYDTPYETAAIETLEEIFPNRKVIGLPSRALAAGGGSFHCCSQQLPAD